jgi:hypothetical protein
MKWYILLVTVAVLLAGCTNTQLDEASCIMAHGKYKDGWCTYIERYKNEVANE